MTVVGSKIGKHSTHLTAFTLLERNTNLMMAKICVEQLLPILPSFLVFSVFLHQHQLRKAHQTLISPTEWLIDGVAYLAHRAPSLVSQASTHCVCVKISKELSAVMTTGSSCSVRSILGAFCIVSFRCGSLSKILPSKQTS